MTSRVQITFRRSASNESAREVAVQKFEKLASQLPYTARCHVVLDRPIASHAKGAPFLARVDIQGAGVRISTEARDLDPCTAIREAFERAQAQASHARRAPRERGIQRAEPLSASWIEPLAAAE